MIWIIVWVLIVVGSVIYRWVIYPRSWDGDIGPVGAGFIALIIGAFVFGGLNAMFSGTGPSDTYDVHLLSLQDNQGVSGSFFLGIGNIDSKFKYAYYWQDGKGGAHLATIDVDDVTVFQNRQTDPVLEFKVHRPNKWLSIFDMGAGSSVDSSHGYDKEFHIPAGSISNNYTLDAK